MLAFFCVLFFLEVAKRKTELSIEFITPSCASLTRGYQQLTHSGSCVVFYDLRLIFIQLIWSYFPKEVVWRNWNYFVLKVYKEVVNRVSINNSAFFII